MLRQRGRPFTRACHAGSSDHSSILMVYGRRNHAAFTSCSICVLSPSCLRRMPALPEQSEAEIRIPAEWLMPGLDLEAVREAQRSDSRATLTGDFLTISGVELTVERRWLREAYWRQARQAVQHGYVYRSSAVAMTVRADRRERDRR